MPTEEEVRKAEAEYGADAIQELKFPENVRERFGMYIGSKDARGLHHLTG